MTEWSYLVKKFLLDSMMEEPERRGGAVEAQGGREREEEPSHDKALTHSW